MPGDVAALSRRSQIREETKLLLHLTQDHPWKSTEPPLQPAVIDSSALVNHQLAFLGVTRQTARKNYPKQALPRESRRAGDNPGRLMSGGVQEIGLDDQDRAELPGLGSTTRAKIRDVEPSVFDPQAQSSPSATSASSSSFASFAVARRVASDARR